MLVVNEKCTYVIDANVIKVIPIDNRFEIVVSMTEGVIVKEKEKEKELGGTIALFDTEEEAKESLRYFVESKDPLYFVKISKRISK